MSTNLSYHTYGRKEHAMNKFTPMYQISAQQKKHPKISKYEMTFFFEHGNLLDFQTRKKSCLKKVFFNKYCGSEHVTL